ncbi:cbb3-type cytochrome oxidase assembly protein CcoS, partial [Rickettsiales endosymbiont of Trichoplax sp. H2]
MGVLLFLIPLAVLIALLGVIGVFWSIRNNQFDDLKSQSEK